MGKAKGSTGPSLVEKRARRSFSAEFKLEAVHLMRSRRSHGVSLEQIGRELEVRPDQLRAWGRQVEQRSGAPPTDVFPGQGKLPSAEDEIRRLTRELDVTRQERDFLKKASAYFAKESR
jgi:transposase